MPEQGAGETLPLGRGAGGRPGPLSTGQADPGAGGGPPRTGRQVGAPQPGGGRVGGGGTPGDGAGGGRRRVEVPRRGAAEAYRPSRSRQGDEGPRVPGEHFPEGGDGREGRERHGPATPGRSRNENPRRVRGPGGAAPGHGEGHRQGEA